MLDKRNIEVFKQVFSYSLTSLILTILLFSWLSNEPLINLSDSARLMITEIISGYYLIPMSSIFIATSLICSIFLIIKGHLKRFIGIQLIIIIMVAWLGSTLSVLMYSLFLQGPSDITLSTKDLFTYLKITNQSGDISLFLSLIIGFGFSISAYVFYLTKYLFNLYKPLGNARFANGFDLYKSGLFNSSGFILAKSFYGKLKFTGFEPIIFISGTGGGKTKAIAIPNMFELNNENIVVTDIKGEIYKKTHKYRRAIGNNVFRFEPEEKNTDTYNPLALVRTEHLDEDLDVIFKTLIPNSSDPIWADASRNIAKMLSMFQILEEESTPTLQGIYQEICSPNFIENVEAMYETIQTPRVANLFGKFLSAREKTQQDLLLNAQEYLSKFDSPNLARATNSNDIDLNSLRFKPTTIYLIMPANTETFGPICAIFFEQMIRLNTHQEPKTNHYSINAIIDEFANLPKMPSVAKGITFLRSYRIRVCVFVQQSAQLREVYGENNRENFMSSPVKVAFNITSKADAQYFSELCGKKTIKLTNQTTQHNLQTNLATHKQDKHLLSPDEIMRLSKSKLMILITGFYPIKACKNFQIK